MGMIVYADDIFLLAPNRSAAQIMLNICDKFASENNIRFSTHPEPRKSKSKAMYVVGPKSNAVSEPRNLSLSGQTLPWVKRCDHLGHTLTSDGHMSQDGLEKSTAN